jgi:hypothetical protein
MKVGTKSQLQHKINELKDSDPELLAELMASIEWLSPVIWCIPEDGDSFEEEELKVKLILAGKNRYPEMTAHNGILTGTPQKAPTVKRPGFSKKLAQYIKTVTGPKVTDVVFNKRLSKCTKEGGCTFAPVSGRVVEVGAHFVRIDDTIVMLAVNEKPSVAADDHVEHGQTIASSETAKPCPYLNVKHTDQGVEYYCGECGCGERKQAELKTKLYYARVVCPRTPSQFNAEDESGPNVVK